MDIELMLLIIGTMSSIVQACCSVLAYRRMSNRL